MSAKPIPPPPPGRVKVKGTNRHVRRVTLNLLRHAECCPEDLRIVLDKLATPLVDWDMDKLSRLEKELIFATVDGELADRAKDEFEADTNTIVDLSRQSEIEPHCKLCGHPHIRWEFTLINNAGGRPVNTGSRCIETYGINVDGERTADEALKALRRAIAKAKRQADREDWQTAHPTHAADMKRLEHHLRTLEAHRNPWKLYTALNPGWQRRCGAAISSMRAVVRYYRKNEFLTDNKTAMAYGVDGKPGMIDSPLIAELTDAKLKREETDRRWKDFMSNCPDMKTWERTRVEIMMRRGTSPDNALRGDRIMLRDVWLRNGNPIRPGRK